MADEWQNLPCQQELALHGGHAKNGLRPAVVPGKVG
jgi:hypothetical protein